MAKVLIIDDDSSMCAMLSNLVNRMGHEASCRRSLDGGLQAAMTAPYDVVFLDVQMPDGSGLDILPAIRATASTPAVIIMTGFGSADGAEMAIKNGAWDYIQKSDSPRKILLSLKRVLQYREGMENTRQHACALKLDGIVGSSAPMKACYDLVAQAVTSDTSVLLAGETGTGKELFAHAIHNNSIRSKGNFIVVDCAALPETLVESLLFGHAKGAYTGADKARKGLVAQAHGGTLFLDEVGELPLCLQKKFLRVLQEHRYRPVGAKEEVASDFRLVAATNRNLETMTQEGRFRNDLLFRMRALSITLPPLCKRLEDIRLLVNHHLSRLCERQRIGTKGTSSDFMDMLTQYGWPGNVRELINTLESVISASGKEEMLFSSHLPEYIRIQVARASLSGGPPPKADNEAGTAAFPDLPPLKTYRKKAAVRAEKEYFHKLARLTRGDARAACRVSKLSRSRFYELVKLHGVSLGQYAPDPVR